MGLVCMLRPYVSCTSLATRFSVSEADLYVTDAYLVSDVVQVTVRQRRKLGTFVRVRACGCSCIVATGTGQGRPSVSSNTTTLLLTYAFPIYMRADNRGPDPKMCSSSVKLRKSAALYLMN